VRPTLHPVDAYWSDVFNVDYVVVVDVGSYKLACWVCSMWNGFHPVAEDEIGVLDIDDSVGA